MNNNTKITGGAILLAGAAAFAYYKYSKMTKEEKAGIGESIKEFTCNMYEKYVPEKLKNMFDKQTEANSSSSFSNPNGAAEYAV